MLAIIPRNLMLQSGIYNLAGRKFNVGPVPREDRNKMSAYKKGLMEGGGFIYRICGKKSTACASVFRPPLSGRFEKWRLSN